MLIQGEVNSGLEGIASDVRLLSITDLDGAGSELIATTKSDAAGQFRFDIPTLDQGKTYYLMASQGKTVLGGLLQTVDAARQVGVVVNDLTTLALAFTLNSFIQGDHIRGDEASRRAASYSYRNLVDQDGTLASTLLGNEESAQRLNSLANLFAASRTSPLIREQLFELTAVGHDHPSTTLEAATNLVQNPTQNTLQLFALAQQVDDVYGNALSADDPPAAWILFLEHFAAEDASDSPMFGPGNIAVDRRGDLWIANNFNPDVPTSQTPFPSQTAIRLNPGGELVDGRPIRGGGIYGSGFGIGIDTKHRVWIGNFGFGGGTAVSPDGAKIPLHGNGNSLSVFDQDGSPRSPDSTTEFSLLSKQYWRNSEIQPSRQPSGGFTEGDMLGVQGVVSDLRNNIWIASNRSTHYLQDPSHQPSKLVVYPKGVPEEFVEYVFDSRELNSPFDIAIDSDGDAWVTFQKGGEHQQGGVAEFSFDPITGLRLKRQFESEDFNAPYGIAVAPDDGVWIANNGGSPAHVGHQVIRIDQQKDSLETFDVGDFAGPWGINIDGAGHVYVTGFSSRSVFVLQGIDRGSERQRGDLLSPLRGYKFNKQLERPTGIELDSLGNVWICNNYSTNPRDYGARSVFQILGLADPVVTPLIGPAAPLL